MRGLYIKVNFSYSLYHLNTVQMGICTNCQNIFSDPSDSFIIYSTVMTFKIMIMDFLTMESQMGPPSHVYISRNIPLFQS